MDLFQTTLIEDYLTERFGVSNPSGLTIINRHKEYVNVEYQNAQGEQVEKDIYVWGLIDFMYSKIKSQETEAPEEVVVSQEEEALEMPFTGLEFKDTWRRFNKSVLESKGVALSTKKAKKILDKMANWYEEEAVRALEHSITNGYLTVSYIKL